MVVFFVGPPDRGHTLVEKIDHIIVGLIQLRLRKVGQQTIVSAVAIDDQDLLAAIASHLVRRRLQQGQL